MTKSVYILLLFLGAVFAAPAVLSACETQKKECCASEQTEKTEITCHAAQDADAACHEGRNCCGSNTCRCISLNQVPGLPESSVYRTRTRFSTPAKPLFASVTQTLCDGFYTLRLPPKIV